MDNRVRHTLGLGPNTQIVIDPHGEIIHSLGWSDAAVLRNELVDAIGASPTTTKVADLNLDRQAPYRSQRAYIEGVLEKPTFNSELVAVKVQPIVDGNEPLYVKPRLEVASSVLNEGAGELYLSFFLDPIHDVHWNNLAAPLKYELTYDDGTLIEPASQAAPKVEQESDDDPREFALKVSQVGDSRKAELAIHYFACSKDEGWCRPVTQKYAIYFEIDPDGGGTNGRSFRVGGGGRRGPGPGPRNANRPPQGRGGPGIEEMRERIRNMDSNGDGLISLDEASQGMRQQFPNMDLDSSGSLDHSEIESMLERRFSQRGPGGAGQPQGFNPRSIKERILNSDANGDGRITREELPPQMQRRFQQMDANDDGSVDESEIDEMLRNRPSPQTRPNRRPGSGQI